MAGTARPTGRSDAGAPLPADSAVSAESLEKAATYIEEEEGAQNRLGAALGVFVTIAAIVMSLFHLYTAYAIVPTQTLRPVHVAFVLFISFLVFPVARRFRDRVMWWDWIAALAAIVIVVYMIQGGDDFTDRSTLPNVTDIALGIALIVLVLEATRRTSGLVMPIVVLVFLVYALVGPWLPAPWTHKGYEIGRLVGHLYMTLEGIFGTAVDVSSSLIILFTIFGAFLQFSGAGKFFIDWSFAVMGGKPTSAGRTVVLASFLLGGPSGSGVATTVTLGSVAYPMLAKAGYGRDAAGGLLAAGGLGAIISPPVLGAAAFLIAEFLKISYLDVLLMAVVPTCLYYFALFFMVELDTRRFGLQGTTFVRAERAGALARRYWFHFLSLVSIIAFMLMGFSPVMSVFWATIVAFATSFLHRDCAMLSRDLFGGAGSFWSRLAGTKLVQALQAGSIGMLNVGATCAAAGIIVGVVTLTGLGLKFSAIVLEYADSGSRALTSLATLLGFTATPALVGEFKLLLTAIFTSLIVWIVGLAVPVTASYIICAVIAAPALIKLGVPEFAAHMFIFYYAVLSEVSPPTALSPFAAAAITGGDPYKTTLQSWKYTMPAFLVPFMFVLDPAGVGLLLNGSMKALADANWGAIAIVTFTAAVGIAALAGGMQNWFLRECRRWERWMLIIAGLLLVYPRPAFDIAGVALVVIVLAAQRLRPRAV